jgi:hypothetical protein
LIDSTLVSLYVVKNPSGTYFAGFDSSKGEAHFVTDPYLAKLFSNRHDIKLRPEEMIVELTIDLARSDVKMSEPFRPQRRVKQQFDHA